MSEHVPTQIQVPDLIDIVPPAGLTEEQRQLYDNMVQYMKLKIQRPFTASKIIMLVANGIKFLGKVKTLSGSQKKDLVLHALREVIQRSSYIQDYEKPGLIILVDTFGDSLTDNLVEFAENAYAFAKKKAPITLRCCAGSEPETSRETLGNLEELKAYLKLKFQRPITAPKIISLVADGVKYIEQYRELSGAEKKDIVIRALRDIIQECDFLSDGDKAELIGYVDMFASDTIDYLVEFGKKLYLKAKKGCC